MSAPTARDASLTLLVEGMVPKQVADFNRAGGREVVLKQLLAAGFTSGRWKLKLKRPFYCTGHTPAFRVKRATSFGVDLELKPGDNSTSITGTLVVERDKGLAADVAKRLQAADSDQVELTMTKTAKETMLTPAPPAADTSVLLTAIAGCEDKQWPGKASFLTAVAKEIGPLEVRETWQPVVAQLADDGLVAETPTGYRLTDDGRSILGLPPKTPAAAPLPAIDPVADLIANTGKLAELEGLVRKLKEIRDSQAALETTIKEKQEQLARRCDDERQLLLKLQPLLGLAKQLQGLQQ